MSFVERRIGDKVVVVNYAPGSRDYAVKRLDEEQAAFEEALNTIGLGIDILVDQIIRTHERLENVRQNTCAKCGHQTLRERRDRMRVFGGLFYTDSEPSPYKHCTNCGHDQENNLYHPVNLEGIRRHAQRRLDIAQKLVSKYVSEPKHPNSGEKE